MESKSATYKPNSQWVLRIRILRAETMQYVEKAHLQDSVQLFFAVIAGVTGIFGIWVGIFYGWAVIVYDWFCTKVCKRKSKKKEQVAKNGSKINPGGTILFNDMKTEIQQLKYEMQQLRNEMRNSINNNNNNTKQQKQKTEIELVAIEAEKAKASI